MKILSADKSPFILGMWRVCDKPQSDINSLVSFAVEHGVNKFDNADIYGGGSCEEIFGKALKAGKIKREDIFIQTKCGIRSNRYDLSAKHILKSVDDSLKRMNVDYIDSLLLHRPDPLMRGEEIAEAFDALRASGKVREFGVSNFNARQTEYLSKFTELKFDQIQLGLMHSFPISAGMNFNTASNSAIMRDDGILDYCRLHSITVQCYSPMQCSFTDNGYAFSGCIFAPPAKKKLFALHSELNGLAQKYSVTPEAVAAAWLLHLPESVNVILGTTNKDRLASYLVPVKIDDNEWYRLYVAAGNVII